MNWLYRIYGIRWAVLHFVNSFFNVLWMRKLGNRVKIFGWPIIAIAKDGRISVGKNVVLISDSFFSEPGINHPVIIRIVQNGGKIEIGNNVGMSGGGICAAQEVIIGNNVMFGANAFVTDTDFHPLNCNERRYSQKNIAVKQVRIGNNVFLGMNVLVLKGVTIGENSIIAAGSIVTSDIPRDCIAGGIPARIINNL